MDATKTKPVEMSTNGTKPKQTKSFEVVATVTNEIPLALVFSRLDDLIEGVADSAAVTGKKGEGEPMLTVQSKKVQVIS